MVTIGLTLDFRCISCSLSWRSPCLILGLQAVLCALVIRPLFGYSLKEWNHKYLLRRLILLLWKKVMLGLLCSMILYQIRRRSYEKKIFSPCSFHILGISSIQSHRKQLALWSRSRMSQGWIVIWRSDGTTGTTVWGPHSKWRSPTKGLIPWN